MVFKKILQFKYILISLALFLAGTVLFIGSVKLFATRQANPELNESIIDTANIAEWPVYINEEYYYSIRHPHGWRVDELPGDDFVSFEPVFIDTFPVNIQILHNEKKLPLIKRMKEMGHRHIEEECAPLIINNVNGVLCPSSEKVIAGEQFPNTLYLINQGKGIIYSIRWTHTDMFYTQEENAIFLKSLKKLIPADEQPESLAEAEQKVFEKIISTFQILED